MRLCMYLLAAVVLLSGRLMADDLFWYAAEGQAPLAIDSVKIAVLFEDTASAKSSANLSSLMATFPRIISYPEESAIDRFVVCSLRTGDGYWAFLDSLKVDETVELAEPYYRTSGGDRCLVGKTICAAFDTSVTQPVIDSICDLLRIDLADEIIGLDNVFAVHNTDSSGSRLVDLANTLHQFPELRYAHPSFGMDLDFHGYTVYDEYKGYQWQIRQVIGELNVATVWDFKGFNYTPVVAVLDQGISPDHEDLPASRILPGKDFASQPYDDDPSPDPKDVHGMACAGLIAASHDTIPLKDDLDGTGIISINPQAMIMPIRVSPGGGPSEAADVAAAIGYAWTNGADVLSCSWGYSYSNIFFGIPVINDALYNAYLDGRGGLGCILVFSSGNDEDPWVAYPASLDICLAVGASKADGRRYEYSNYGQALDVVAPSGDYETGDHLLTLDQMGDLGINTPGSPLDCWEFVEEYNYICNFGGTSAAAPIVAGIASLLIARDSTLTQIAIHSIIRRSAVTDFDWGSIDPPDYVVYGLGWGRADAFRAVLSISRGDLNLDGNVTLGDLARLIDILFVTFEDAYPDRLLADCDCDGAVGLGDLTRMIDYLFVSFEPLPSPCFEYGD